MKKIIPILLLAVFLSGCLGHRAMDTDPTDPCPETETDESNPQTEATLPHRQSAVYSGISQMKAMWLSQFDLSEIYMEGEAQRDQADFTSRMGIVLDDLARLGFNTVFLQVRPNADSMYPSEYYPMSKYVVGSYGCQAVYDPVEIILELAGERGLSVHAWINPLRCMTDDEIRQVPERYLLRQWYEDSACRGTYLVQQGNTWYLNPAYPQVRDLITGGAEELLRRYDFAGLHMDDYFYPTTDASFDADAYAAYQESGGSLTLEEFRRDALNILVKRLHDATGASDPERVFGISPAGNIQTVYETQYADVYTWCAVDGYVDYICPQVYFGLEHQNFDFRKVCDTWNGIIRTESVKLVVGMTFGKAFAGEDNYAGTGKREWQENKDILKRCLLYTAELDRCVGVSVFCYQYYRDPVSGALVHETEMEWENFLSVFSEVMWKASAPENG